MTNCFHDHVCPECNGFWEHQDGHCPIPPGEDLMDPMCEAEVGGDLIALDDQDFEDILWEEKEDAA